jgi:hypothetical protein
MFREPLGSVKRRAGIGCRGSGGLLLSFWLGRGNKFGQVGLVGTDGFSGNSYLIQEAPHDADQDQLMALL